MAGRSPGWPLNHSGTQQAKRLALALANFPVRAIYTSPLTRTLETAAEIRKIHPVPLVEDESLAEVEFGDWTGKSFAELHEMDAWKRFNQYRSMVSPPNGELMLEVQSRMVAALGRIRECYRDAIVVIVSHADPLRVYLAHILGISLDHIQRFRIAPASLSVVQIDDEWQEVLALNRTESFTL